MAAAARLTDPERRRLQALLADDRPAAERLLGALRDLRRLDGVPAFSSALRLLIRVDLPETQAERLLSDLLEHRRAVHEALGRDPGLRVAAVDYLTNVERLLSSPTVVERAQLERTERSAVTDALTRLYNQHRFRQALELEIKRSRRYGVRLSLLLLDIDGFKPLNDAHGHLFGDLVLQRVGQILRASVREADVPCRYGGEEFAIVLPETDRLGAFALAERIRRQTERGFAGRPVGGKLVRITFSGGIAQFPEDGPDAEALVASADRALYRSKREGKDRVTLFHDEKRREVRYPARPRATARLRTGGGGEADPARLLNVSRTGVLMELGGSSGVARRATVELTFQGRDPAGELRRWSQRGRVVRVEPRAGEPTRLAVAFDGPLPTECLRQQVRRARAPAAAREGIA